MKHLNSDKYSQGLLSNNDNELLKLFNTLYPNIILFDKAIRESDGIEFNTGDWVEIKTTGNKAKILGFDIYNYPLPFKHKAGSGYKQIIRAIYYNGFSFIFDDLDDWHWLR